MVAVRVPRATPARRGDRREAELLRGRPSVLLDRWVAAMLRRRLAVLALVTVVTGALVVVAMRLPLLTNLRDMLPDDTPEFAAYDAARGRFGGDELVLLALEDEALFTEAGLARLARVTEALEAHPFVDRVLSLVNAEEMRLEGDALVIEPYVREGRAPADVRAAALADPLVRGTLVSEDGRVAVVGARLVPTTAAAAESLAAEIDRRSAVIPGAAVLRDQPDGARHLLEACKILLGPELVDLAVEAGYPREQVHAAGFPVILGTLLTESEHNIKVLFPVTLAVLVVVLVVTLRRALEVALPLLCVLPAVVWAVAIGGTVFGRVTIFTSVAPIMVLVVGVSDVVHIVTQFRHGMARGLARDEAIAVAFREVGSACALTSLTTLVGFGSMIFLPLPYSRELGVFAAAGVVCAFVLAFVLTPVLLSFTHPSPARSEIRGPLTRLLGEVGYLVSRHARVVMAVGMVATVAALAALPHVTVENALTEKLPSDHPVRRAFAVVDRHGGGTVDFELLIDTGAPDGVKDPRVVAGLAALQRKLETDPRVAHTLSIADLLGRMHRLLAPDRAAAAPTPGDRALIAQYLLLFEMSGGRDLDTMVDPTGRYTRMVLRTPTSSAETLVAVADDVEALARELLPSTVRATTSGIGLLTARAGPVILETSLQGLGVALGLIALLMAVLFRSVRVGLLSLVPNVLPVVLGVLLVDAVVGRLDADALIFMAISLGIAVDDTIHFLSRYRIERGRGRDRVEAVSWTLRETGHGIVRTSIVLCAGFAVVAVSEYAGLRTLGLMLPTVLAVAVLLDLTMVPAMARLGLLEPRAGTAHALDAPGAPGDEPALR